MKAIRFGLVMLVAVPLLIAAQEAAQAQAPADPLAAAARQTREQRKDQPKAAHVWDNDNIPNNPGAVSVVGQSSEGNSSEGAAQIGPPPGNPPSAPAASPARDRGAIENDLADAKDHLQSLQTDLDILQRTYTLDQQVYYGKPDFSSDAAGAAKLKNEQAQIDAKQQEIIEAQKKLGDLQTQLNSAPAPAPPSNPPANSGSAAGNGSSASAPANPGDKAGTEPAEQEHVVPSSN